MRAEQAAADPRPMEFDDEQALGLADHHAVNRVAEDRDAAAKVDHRAIDELNRFGIERDNMTGRLHRGAERRKLADAQHFARFDGMENELDRRREGERSFRPHEQPRRIVPPRGGRGRRQSIDVVPADPAQHFRKSGGDLRRQILAQSLQPGHQLPDGLWLRRALSGPIGTEAETRAVRENRIDGRDIVGHQAIADRLPATGIVGRHAADGAARVRRRIDRKEQAMRLRAALRWPSTIPGSTNARRRSGSISSTLRRYFEQSRTNARLTVWPH